MKSTGKRLAEKDSVRALVLGVIAAVMMFQYWGPPSRFLDVDTLYYEAQAKEVTGTPRLTALHSVFASDLATELKEVEASLPPSERNVGNREWAEYSAQFYRRRWTIPVAAAALNPVFGTESLETLSLLGYVAATMLLYLLLRRRFSPFVSAIVTLGCLLVPSFRLAASDGTTDTWGLTFLIAGLICAALVLERGRQWLLPWFVTVVVISFTRDLTPVLVAAAATVALQQRTRISLGLFATGVLAAIPAPLFTSAPLRESLAFSIEGFNVPADSSWSFIISHYPGQLWEVFSHDLTYPLDFAFPLPMFVELLVILGGIAALFITPARGDGFTWMMRGAFLGGVITVSLAALYSTWKLELSMLPAIAFGVALLLTYLAKFVPVSMGGDRLRSLIENPQAATASPAG